MSDSKGQWTVVPDGSVPIQQIAADEVGSSHVFMTGNCNQGFLKAICHVFNKTGFTASCRAFQHHRKPLRKGCLEESDFIGQGLVVRLGLDKVLIYS